MTTAPLDSFETALLSRLREHAGRQPALPPHRSRRRVLVGAAVTVAAAGVVVLVVPGLGPTAAYSVQEGNSGTITVEVRRPEDAKGLQADLAEHGVTADVTYVPEGQECAPGRYAPVGRRLPGMTVSIGSTLLRVTLPPGTVRDGETFVMAVSGQVVPPSSEPRRDGVADLGGYESWTDFDVSAGPVRPCQVVPSTATDRRARR